MSKEHLLDDNCCYGCLFCKTGQEHKTAINVETAWPGVMARAVSVVKRRSKAGVKRLQAEIMIPSYVFFRANDDFQPFSPLPEGVWRILRTGTGEWRLTGRDAWFAQWLLNQNGEIGLSTAYKVGDRIHIHRGPLKDLEGSILRMDRRNKSGQVSINIDGREIKVWLGFELLEEVNPFSDEVSFSVLAPD